MSEPAGPKNRKEKILDPCTGLRDTHLHHLELMLDGVLAFVLHAAGDHRLVRRRRVDDARSWDVAKLVVDGIELSKLRHMPFLLMHQDGSTIARLQRSHFHAGNAAV